MIVSPVKEQAEALLGRTSQELGTLMSTDEEAYSEVFLASIMKVFEDSVMNQLFSFQNASCKRYVFKLSCRADNYNGETRARHTVRNVAPVEFKDESLKAMIKDLENNGIEIPPFVEKQKYV